MSVWLPVTDLAAQVQAGTVKSADLVAKSLQLIAAKKAYNAVLWTLDEAAKARAQHIDQTVASGLPAGRLAGVPFIAKDNFLVFGSETTAASNILKGFHAPYQSTAIERLEAEGAICVAKANLDAFAHGGSTENSDFGVTSNPHDMERIAGGSSGGSAAAVALELAPFALGTDTGGSIRQPASFSGCVGYKPTYGLVSRSGVVAMASSLDVIGPMTSTVEDAALILDVIAAKDPLDSTTIERSPDGYLLSRRSPDVQPADWLTGKKIGLVAECMVNIQPGVKQAIEQTVKNLQDAGAIIETVHIPTLPQALAVYYIICPAEVSSNLSRYDGQRYGYSYPQAKTLDDSFAKSRGKGFGKEAKRRVMIGTYVLSSGFYDAYYKRAQTVRTKLINEFNTAFAEHDFLVGPVTPTTAFKIGENSHDPLQMYLSDVMTVSANLVGIPAISLPCGLVNGLPVGLQLMAPQKQDRALLELAQQTELLAKYSFEHTSGGQA